MAWNKAIELVDILKAKGWSDGDIIAKLVETTDRYRGRSDKYKGVVDSLEQELIDLKKAHGLLVQIEVDMIQDYRYKKVIYYKGHAYTYSSRGIWKHSREPDGWPDVTSYGKFKVWVELHESARSRKADGQVAGFVGGMTCITIDNEQLHSMYLNHGDQVVVTKVRKP